jgi:hypothetical protein
MDNLRYIRETMERSTSFTAVSGAAGVAMGGIALAAAWLASRSPTPEGWLATWLGAALLSGVVALWAMARKARASGVPLLSGPARKFALGFAPPIAVGGLLTMVLFRGGLLTDLPGAWLLLYTAFAEIPLLVYLGGVRHPIVFLHPLQPALLLAEGAFRPLGAAELAYGIGAGVTWCAVLFVLASGALERLSIGRAAVT